MKHLLWTELNYQKSRLLGIAWVIPGFYLYTLRSHSQSWYLLPTIMTIAICVRLTIEKNLEKRIRHLSVLPISPARIAKQRILLIGFPWLIFHGLFLICHLIFTRTIPSWQEGGMEIIMFTGLFILGISLYLFQRDFMSVVLRTENKFGIDSLILLGLIAITVYGIPLSYYFIAKGKIVSNWILITGVNVIGIILICLTIFSFACRRSYLE